MRPLLFSAWLHVFSELVFSVVLIVLSCEMVNRWNKGLTKTPGPVHFSLSYGRKDGSRLSRSLGGLNKTHQSTLVSKHILSIYLSIHLLYLSILTYSTWTCGSGGKLSASLLSKGVFQNPCIYRSNSSARQAIITVSHLFIWGFTLKGIVPI